MSGSATTDRKVLVSTVPRTILLYVQGARTVLRDYRFGMTIRDSSGRAIYNVLQAPFGSLTSPNFEGVIELPNRKVDKHGGTIFLSGLAFAPRAGNQISGSALYRCGPSPTIILSVKATLDTHKISEARQRSGSTTGPTDGYSYGATAEGSGTVGPVGLKGSVTGSRTHAGPIQRPAPRTP